MPEPTSSLGNRKREDALQQGARKKHIRSDPLVHRGRHFGRTVFAFCNVKSLISNGLIRMAELTSATAPGEEPSVELLSVKERREERIFRTLLKMCPGLERRIFYSASDKEVGLVSDLIQKGVNAARADDTKGMKGVIIDWITPPDGVLLPPLSRRHKVDRGFKHEKTGALLCPAGLSWQDPIIKEKLRSGEMRVRGDNWPIFFYANYKCDINANPWDGLLKSQILVNAYKHVFTSPSSVDDDEPKAASKSGNARIHGMTEVTLASLAYIATQVHFALSSANSFSRTDMVTDSERFYNSLLDLLEDSRERPVVHQLLAWWNRKIFPHTSPESVLAPVEGSILERIRRFNAEQDAQAAHSGSV
ncbi:hypothetical protein Hypma_009847 [Hypsizygus marmoreus]|uniref:Uncharacterized protein n=1 Tax=Hypsizygus marmoreus TaxID=39966 RepID=A0A369JM54_HYPMA|nr:hypothetical protein Hypma_009847 [Hypsizygus marmoreus]